MVAGYHRELSNSLCTRGHKLQPVCAAENEKVSNLIFLDETLRRHGVLDPQLFCHVTDAVSERKQRQKERNFL